MLAGTHYVAARPATLEFRETAIDAPRLRRRRIRLAVGGGDALYPPSGRTGRGRRARRRAARQPGRRQSYGQAILAAGALRSPAATFRDASRVSIGTLDLRDTTQLTFDNTRPYNIATGQGVQISQLLFGGGNTLTITGNGGFGFQGGISVLGPMPPIRARPCQPRAAS